MVPFNAHLPAILAWAPQARLKKIALHHQLINLPLLVIARNHLLVGRVKLVYRRIISLCRITASLGKLRSYILNRGTLQRPDLRGLSVFACKHLLVIDVNYISSITLPWSFLHGLLQAQLWP